MKTRILTLCALALAATLVAAADSPSVDRGKELFNNKALGTNGKSCADCHPDGVGKASAYDAARLEKIANRCIANALDGTPLLPGSSELVSLVMYMKSLAPAAP